jgi:predicted RNA-binding protein with TRAM domain
MRNDRGYGGGFQRSIAPVKVGDELDVKIEAVGEKGDGIAKKDGFVLFVPGTKTGQNVRIRVTRVLQKVGFAEVAGQSEASDESSDSSQEESESSDSGSEESSVEEMSSSSEDSDDFGEEAE